MLGYIATFASGVIIGAGGKFFADWLTDARRKRESSASEQRKFERVCEKMPELIAKMREDLRQHPHVRRFAVLPTITTLARFSDDTFRYGKANHKGLMGKVALLEESGYVEDIRPGDTPIYRFTEDFVDLLQFSDKTT